MCVVGVDVVEAVIQNSTLIMEKFPNSVFIGGHAMDIAIGADGIGYIAGTSAVYRVDTRAHVLTGTFRTGSFYATGVEPSSGDVYLADAGNFVGPGTVYVFAPNGQLRTSFVVGIIPAAFAFTQAN